jgi:AcrR family transcriptional regulator
MFTKKVNSTMGVGAKTRGRQRGRPAGRTPQGHEMRQRLYGIAVRMIGEHGYESTTLRDVAREAGVSVGLLYKYFPSKRSVVLALYDELSAEYAARAMQMPTGKWRERFVFALRTCLDVLGPYRHTLSALRPVLLGDQEESLFAVETAFSRRRVESVFIAAVAHAKDAPGGRLPEALGRLLYLLHLAVILWWLFDRSPRQRGTIALIALIEKMLPPFGMALLLPQVQGFVRSADGLVREGLFGEAQ